MTSFRKQIPGFSRFILGAAGFIFLLISLLSLSWGQEVNFTGTVRQIEMTDVRRLLASSGKSMCQAVRPIRFCGVVGLRNLPDRAIPTARPGVIARRAAPRQSPSVCRGAGCSDATTASGDCRALRARNDAGVGQGLS